MPLRNSNRIVRGSAFTGAGLVVTNTEVLALGKANALGVVQFTPGKTGLPILDSEGKRFTRFRIHYVNISYNAVDTATSGVEIAWGIAAGIKREEVKDKATILTLRPSRQHNTFTTANLTLGKVINPQTWMYCEDVTRDGCAFCLYYISGNSNGSFKFSYSISFDYPNPIPAAAQDPAPHPHHHHHHPLPLQSQQSPRTCTPEPLELSFEHMTLQS